MLTNEEVKTRLMRNISAIRQTLDSDILDVDIECQKNKLIKLTQLVGLAAETKAQARKNLENGRLIAFSKMRDSKLSPSILLKMVDSEISEELSLYEYADRLNAGISNSIEGLRSVLSLYKTELEMSIKGHS